MAEWWYKDRQRREKRANEAVRRFWGHQVIDAADGARASPFPQSPEYARPGVRRRSPMESESIMDKMETVLINNLKLFKISDIIRNF